MKIRDYLTYRLDLWSSWVLAGAYGVNHSKNSMEELHTKIQDNTIKDPTLGWVMASDRANQREEVAVDRFVQSQQPKVRRLFYLLHVGLRTFHDGRFIYARSTPAAAAQDLGKSEAAVRSAYDRALKRLQLHLRAPTVTGGAEMRQIARVGAVKWLRRHRRRSAGTAAAQRLVA